MSEHIDNLEGGTTVRSKINNLIDKTEAVEGYKDDAEAAAVQTAEDRVQTGEDRVQTGEDRVQTGEDRVQTGEDRVQTGEDRVATGEDVISAEAAKDKARESADSILHNTKATTASAIKATTASAIKATTASAIKATETSAIKTTETANIKDTSAAGIKSTETASIKETTTSGVKATETSPIMETELEEYAASTMPFTPTVTLLSDTVQDAIEEVDAKVEALDEIPVITESAEVSVTPDTILEITIGGRTFIFDAEEITES
jgi:hypothetical protein